MVRQNYSEAIVADIRVAVLFGLSIWYFFVAISCFSLFSVCSVWGDGCTLSAGEFFCGVGFGFLFVFSGLFWAGLVFWVLLLVFCGAFLCWFA